MIGEDNRTLEWYLERLPDTIQYKWIGRFEPGPHGYQADSVVHWSDGLYEYELKIYKIGGKWVIHYELPGWDGDIDSMMPEYEIKSEEMIKEDSEWMVLPEDFSHESLLEGAKWLWSWLKSQKLVED